VIFIYLFRVVFLPLFFPKEEMADPEALKHMIMVKLVTQKPLQTKHVHVTQFQVKRKDLALALATLA
jgi:hypothetical protein